MREIERRGLGDEFEVFRRSAERFDDQTWP